MCQELLFYINNYVGSALLQSCRGSDGRVLNASFILTVPWGKMSYVRIPWESMGFSHLLIELCLVLLLQLLHICLPLLLGCTHILLVLTFYSLHLGFHLSSQVVSEGLGREGR